MLNFKHYILIVCLANLCYLYVLPNPDKIPYMFRQLIPSQFQERLFHMSKEDKRAINEIISKHDEFKDFSDALNALKNRRPNLYNLSMEIKGYIDGKIDTLKPEAKDYILNRIDEFRKVRPTIEHKYEYLEILRAIHNTIEEFKKLSEESKTNIAMTFPKIFVYITSEKFKKLIDGLLEDYENFSS
ncbi:Nematode fatty acid retinoid binding family-containing protein [Strongyloides ratti]|uniref:Nematode fatty acid retinoid binding family-containing protein n=1 Tax=Strongyloides ratti TaxID=34506 RepID=A0A090MNL0_STRRB|nr:Nematode fatty acid retinoid binding family-containing protein [Strongyloides ratti]CEF59651.1 Nematode fatty acid retinoid binding family-containing protein [Strongyloides ratti]